MSDYNFIEYDAAKRLAEAFATLEEMLGEIPDNTDERRVFLLVVMSIITAALHSMNDAARQNLLRYARGTLLNIIDEDRGVSRLKATSSQTVLRITLSAPQPRNTLIPQNTRATPDGKLFFATAELLTIPAGELTGEVRADAMTPGVAANGLPAGTIKTLVDPIPYVASVLNITTTSGGADTELDDPYRERIRQRPETFTTTGTDEAYIYWAMTASSAIQDVAVTSPSPGRVHLTVLAPEDDEAAIVADVEAICTDRKRRTLTDYVTVSGPDIVDFDIDVTYYIQADDEAKAVPAIEGEGGAIDQYIDWQSSKLGREVNPDYLNMLLVKAGAFKVDIRAPSRLPITPLQVARLGSRSVDREVMAWT